MRAAALGLPQLLLDQLLVLVILLGLFLLALCLFILEVVNVITLGFFSFILKDEFYPLGFKNTYNDLLAAIVITITLGT